MPLENAAKLGNVSALAAVVATLLRFRARACVVLACIAAMLCATTNASASQSVQTKTRVWDFSFAEPLNTWLERDASSRLRLENQSNSAELASASPHAARAAPQVGRTVLGKYPDYVNLAESIGARRFNIPTNIWNKMSPAEQWAANQRFLDRAIARGDEFVLSNPVKSIGEATGWFGRELRYLADHGYRLAEDGARMIR